MLCIYKNWFPANNSVKVSGFVLILIYFLFNVAVKNVQSYWGRATASYAFTNTLGTLRTEYGGRGALALKDRL